MLTLAMPSKFKFSIKSQSGFSLIEMAMVLLILGLLLGGILSAVSVSTDNIRISNTQAQLQEIEEALYGFAQVNGRLPCPATNSSAGLEAPAGGGNCTNYFGFVPSATLGLYGGINEDGLLLDAWQNPYRYGVSRNSGNYFTSVAGVQSFFNNASTLLVSNTDMIRVCNTNDCSGTILADPVPAIIISMGENWATYTSTNETENSGETTLGTYDVPNDRTFVDTEFNETNFDDELRWLSPHILFSRLIQAGQLP